MRVSMLIPLYSLFSFLSLCFPEAKVYLLPWLDVFQANSLCAFFLLMCDYISTSHEQRDVFFAAFTVLDKKSPNGSINGLAWYRVRCDPAEHVKRSDSKNRPQMLTENICRNAGS